MENFAIRSLSIPSRLNKILSGTGMEYLILYERWVGMKEIPLALKLGQFHFARQSSNKTENLSIPMYLFGWRGLSLLNVP